MILFLYFPNKGRHFTPYIEVSVGTLEYMNYLFRERVKVRMKNILFFANYKYNSFSKQIIHMLSSV